MTIVWTKVQPDRWLGDGDLGHYHVVKTDNTVPFAICYVPTEPGKARPHLIGYRTTLANAQYCASIHDRLAIMDKGKPQ